MKLKNLGFLFVVILLLASCGNDDDDNDLIRVPPRELGEVAIEDDAEIVAYLKSHFYNSEDFVNPQEGFDFEIRIGEIVGENSGRQSIFDSPNLITQTISVASSDFGRSDGEVVDHKLYTLIAIQGAESEKPTIGDNVIVRYEGTLLDSILFDGAMQPTNFNLSGVTRGFGNALTNFQTGIGPFENGDGTVSFEDFGVGITFAPSGLSYFDRPPGQSGIPTYAPLVFKIDALTYQKDTDLDGDGIPSILEDRDGDGNLNNDNTDSDLEDPRVFTPDYRDPDDDQDGIPTIEEINLDADGNFLSFRDTDNDGTPDHLDNDL